MKTIAKYQVLGEIGRSAAGATYRARDAFRKREVALKLLSPVSCLGEPEKDRLYTELAACSELSHRHIDKVLDAGEVDGGVYLATVLLAGRDLRAHVSNAELTIAQKVTLIAQVCEGLASAHSKGVAHGNLKPNNIFVVDESHAIILDFGTGIWQSLLIGGGAKLNGLVPNYFAPEQILGQCFDTRSDLYSVGVVLYELLAGRYPFPGAAGVIPREIVHADPEALRKVNPLISEELEQIVVQAMAKDPQARLQSADELAASLYAIAQRLRREQAAVAAVQEAPAAKPEEGAPATVLEKPAPMLESPAAVMDASAPVVETPASTVETQARAVIVEMNSPGPEFSVAPTPALPSEAPQHCSPGTAVPVASAPVLEPVHGFPQAIPPPPRPPRLAARRNRARRRLQTVAAGCVLALALVGAYVSWHNLSASQSTGDQPAPAGQSVTAAKSPAPEPVKPAPVPVAQAPASSPQPAPKPDPALLMGQQILRGQVKSLWEAGQYDEALKLVDDVLATSPGNAEAKAWRKRIRAAQEAEAAMK